MAVHIRLSRVGAKKAPLYRVVVADQRSPRGGRFIERLGTYDPAGNIAGLTVNRERLQFWRDRGAVASHTVDRLLKAAARAEIHSGAVARTASPSGGSAEKTS